MQRRRRPTRRTSGQPYSSTDGASSYRPSSLSDNLASSSNHTAHTDRGAHHTVLHHMLVVLEVQLLSASAADNLAKTVNHTVVMSSCSTHAANH